MRSCILRFATILPILLLAACAGIPAHEGLPAGAQDKFASTDVVLPIHQSEIYIYVPPSTAGAQAGASGGLIGALIGAAIDVGVNDARTTKAEAAVKPLRNALVDYNFDAALQSNVKNELGQVSWIHPDDFRVVRDVTNDSLDGVFDASKDSAVLFVSTDYRLSNDGDVFDIIVMASLFPKDDALKALKKSSGGSGPKTALANSIYHNTFTFEAKVPGFSADRDQYVARWSANNGALMRAALDAGAKQLAAMVASDLQDTDRPLASAASVTTRDDDAQYPVDQTGLLVRQDSGGQLVRMDDGTLKYIESTLPAPSAVSGAEHASPAS